MCEPSVQLLMECNSVQKCSSEGELLDPRGNRKGGYGGGGVGGGGAGGGEWGT